MLFYKDTLNTVHALDSAEFAHLLPAGCQPISEQEALALATPVFTDAQLVAMLDAQIQQRLDNFAATRRYASIMSACTYTASNVPRFKVEAEYCVAARDATWAAAYTILDEVLSGQRPKPASIADFEGELPQLVWPNTGD